MLGKWMDVSSWSYEQWLAAIILVFIVLTVIVVLYRLVKIFNLSKKPSYTPNLRPLRRGRRK